MLSHIRLLFALLSLFATDGEDAGEESDDAANEDRDDAPANDLGDKGKAAIKAERDARKAAEAEARELKARLDKIESEAKKQADAEAAEQGKWQELAEKREADLNDLATERDSLKATNDALLALVQADVDAAWGELPEEIRDAYDGADDDPLAKKQHITRMKKVIERLAAAGSNPGNGPNPKPADGKVPPEIEQRARAAMRPRM